MSHLVGALEELLAKANSNGHVLNDRPAGPGSARGSHAAHPVTAPQAAYYSDPDTDMESVSRVSSDEHDDPTHHPGSTAHRWSASPQESRTLFPPGPRVRPGGGGGLPVWAGTGVGASVSTGLGTGVPGRGLG
ncbi:hypothetical protein GCM10010289_62690 [Streptomyces violascens]|uniref:Uncharacterized protein n=1 Tax=Streptomyces violascens TaxID=67381 RepID=A0ABQ3QSE6_9ACTN|nr:hypothetical protein GCM10010289_62690 [Streptomyces violascens]GHI40210.1 hypothetical protein Sviol_46180 [Streptomyces violascens]